MLIIDHASTPVEWRGPQNNRNIEHRTLLSAANGAQQMALWEVYPPPGAGAPPHVHPHEETITVLRGQIEAYIDGETFKAQAGQTLFIPAGAGHSFAVTGDEKAHLLIAFAAAAPTWERIDWKAWLADR